MRTVILLLVLLVMFELCLAGSGGRRGGRGGRRGGGGRGQRWRDRHNVPQEQFWWKGPNVCYYESREDQNSTREVSCYRSVQSIKCDETDTSYWCRKVLSTSNGTRTVTQVYECCPGFTRSENDYGCPDEFELTDLPTVIEALNLTETTNLLNSTELSDEVFSPDNNITIFAPSDEALQTNTNTIPSLEIKLPDNSYEVMSEYSIKEAPKEDARKFMMGHVFVGLLTTSLMTDGIIIESASPYKTSIRLNTYQRPVKMTTANCKRLTSVDNVASDGVVHVVDGVLQPVTQSLLEMVSKNPELSSFKTVLDSSTLGSLLSDDGQYTLFAPTDDAFQQYSSQMERILNDPKCLENVLKSHLLSYVLCSSVIQDQIRAGNMLGKYFNITRDSDDTVHVDGAQVISADLMATNGVLYIINDVLMPNEVLGLWQLVEEHSLTEFTSLVTTGRLTETFGNLDDVTLFVPSNEAIQSLPSEVVTSLMEDPEELKNVLEYHVVTGSQSHDHFHDDFQFDTVSGDKLRANEYALFPYNRDWTRTVQCATLDPHPIKGCNGIMYIIDKVLIPPKGNVMDVLAQDSRFNTLVELLECAGLANWLRKNGPFTVFAPTDKVFEKIESDKLDELKQKKKLLKKMLKNYVTRGAVCCAGIQIFHGSKAQKLRTQSGKSFSIGRTLDGIKKIKQAEITECDLSATNGVVHAIDNFIHPRKRRKFWLPHRG